MSSLPIVQHTGIESEMQTPNWLARALFMPVLTGILALGSFSCSHDTGSSMSGMTIVRSARARILEATTIARVRIVGRDALTVDGGWYGTDICGYRQSAEVVEVLEGARSDQDFLSDEPLDPGGEYIVALRRLPKTSTAPDDDPLMDKRDRKFLSCRRQLSMHALGFAPVVEIGNELRIDVASSNLVPLELRDAAVAGTVKLDALVDYIKQIRKKHARSRQ